MTERELLDRISSLESQLAASRAENERLLAEAGAPANGGLTIYTDGGCSPTNPGPGGWGVVMVYPNGEEEEMSGFEQSSTNNRMELLAAIRGLEAAKTRCDLAESSAAIEVVTDSKYLSEAFDRYWIVNWKRNGWMTTSGSPVKNKDLWARLDELSEELGDVKWTWTKGHAGDKHNERCDELSKIARNQGKKC